MANFYRLIVGLFVLCAAPAFAVIPLTVGEPTCGVFTPTLAQVVSAYAGSCNANLSGSTPSWQEPVTPPASGQAGACTRKLRCVLGGQVYNANFVVSSAPYGPSYACLVPFSQTVGSPPTGCVCSAGYEELNNSGVCTVAGTGGDSQSPLASQCQDLNDAGQLWAGTTTLGLSVCAPAVGASGFVIATGIFAARTNDGTQVVITGPFSCSAAASCGGVAVRDSSVTCAPGEFPGIVNGVSVCAPRADTNSIASGPAVTTTGSASVGGSGTAAVAPAGTTTTTSSLSCIGTNCNRTTTYKDSSGATLGTSTEAVSKSTFCADNPKVSICIDRSFKAATCPAVNIECDGDAIACGIAKRQQETACQLAVKDAEEVVFYNQEKNKPGNVTADLPTNSTVNIGPSSFSQTELLTGSCIADRVVMVAGTSVTVPFSSVCVHLAMFGNALLAFSFLLGARIVGRG